ncbi:MAG: aminomethyl-transferring glycine dehydrogenase subunit GcvPA [Gemmatimonadetes bacterium]|nr:aminomethyl-transferring glycine dehydrogenase subunit GcvPA [Gemmatimonadota bacterium]
MAYVPHSDADRADMMRVAGVRSVEELFADIPEKFRLPEPLDLPEPLSEWEAVRLLQRLAAQNVGIDACFAGAGMYDHHTPAALDHVLRRSEFTTAYTPYQAEVSQGTLQVIYEFQTMVCELLGMEVANASMYDGASACAEAALMARSIQRGRSAIVVSAALHPHYRTVLRTYGRGARLELMEVPWAEDGRTDLDELRRRVDERTAAVILQNPNFFGVVEELDTGIAVAHDRGALAIAVTDPIACAILRSPGECGADIAVAEGQPLGIPLSFGGPALGLLASREKFVRQMPGRIAGATVDADGRRSYVLALQTREQHIRREKATSNICTNQGLLALAATLYMALVGREGLRQVAETSAQNAHYAFERAQELTTVTPLFPRSPFVREFALRTTRDDSRTIIERGLAKGILAGVSLSRFPNLNVADGLLVAFTEKHSRSDIDRWIEVLS